MIGRQREIEALWRQLEQARQGQPRVALIAATRSVGNLLVRANALAAGTPLLERALELAIAAAAPAEAAECLSCLGHAYSWGGEFGRLAPLGERQLAFAKRCHDPYQLRHVYSYQAKLAIVQGHWDEARQRLQAAHSTIAHVASPEPRAAPVLRG